MQLYVVTWKFDSSENQAFAAKALVDYVDSEKNLENIEGYERICWIHTPQDGTGVVICRAENASILYKIFSPWRDQYGMKWDYKPGLFTEELVNLIKQGSQI